MQKVIGLLSDVYGKGFSFKKDITIPWINQHVTATILVTAKNPTKFTFTQRSAGGLVRFDQNGPLITIQEVGLQTTLTGIDFTAEHAIFQLSGFPDITYAFPK